jgi:hypothetical protein
MELESLIDDILRQPLPVMGFELSRRLPELFPHKGILEGMLPNFNVQAYAGAGLCTMTPRAVPHAQWMTFSPDRFAAGFRSAAHYIGLRSIWWTLNLWQEDPTAARWVRHYLNLITL